MIRLQIMNMRSDRRLLSSKWNKVLCPRMDSVLEKYFLDGRTWNVSLSSDNVFEVHCIPSVMVDLGLRTCSCRKWEINGLVPTVEKPLYSIEDAMILPPLSKRPAGRPKKNRIASTGEFKRVIKCSRCESIGHHNKRTCKEPLLNS
ncbi:hypothetical protein ACSBR2_017203 [Camellia fascicularis]